MPNIIYESRGFTYLQDAISNENPVAIQRPINIPQHKRLNVFRRSGFDVMLLGEYRTSKLCPDCHGVLETFRRRMSPKPWKKNDEVTVHGLLRCQSEFCQQSSEFPSRLWNRDDVATLNQKLTVKEILAGEGRPARFLRAIIPIIPE
ncbi:hypothetical protein HK099_004595 [Clydaea vesicula]|uniref:Transposase n=1 Tax=Clydaea vesicula TaxID=447962 RepID=A0AAD5Y196_9FUNG|nr:hypothetical protein HK099_004595 [Clydaea vesicula]